MLGVDNRVQVRLMAARMVRLVVAVILSTLAGAAFNANSQTETILYSFGSHLSEHDPFPYPSGLVQGSDGNFYGTTENGGTNFAGTMFRITSIGSYTDLYTFGSYPGGPNPTGGPVQGSDGNFYGTTPRGGTNSCNCGTVFRVSSSGSYTNLHSFTGYPVDGAVPEAGLLQGSDGNFYGTTTQGGTTNRGTVFRISPSGNYTNLYSFGSSPNDGVWPNALAQGSDGNFYGTTEYGPNDNGTVFRISPSGTYTILHSFIGPPTDGERPLGRLAQGDDGNFYGTTEYGGTNGCDCGTVFRISPSGICTTLHWFAGYSPDGANPNAGLVQGSDGNFYGTAIGGGRSNGGGTVFRISPNGSYTNLYLFGTYPDAENPVTGLVQGSDGNFYGTTENGGTHGAGAVFRLSVPLNLPANQISEIQFFSVLDSTIVALPIPSVAGETYQLQYSDSMSPVNWINTGGSALSIGGPLVLVDITEPLLPQRFYRAVITP
jgi:uncharacterized repeat protein (TIGR03803 family)